MLAGVHEDDVPVPMGPSAAGVVRNNGADADGTPDRHNNGGGAA